ncbi:hypothetical protein J560_4434, partial [Acinetobacter baumannii 855125]
MLFLNICSCILAWLKIGSALISSASNYARYGR